MIVRVRNIKEIAEKGEAARLKKFRLIERAVFCAVFSGAGQRLACAFHGIDDFDFGIISVRNIQQSVFVGDTERMLKTRLLKIAVDVAELKKIFADNRL